MSILCVGIISILTDLPADDPGLDYVDLAWHELEKRALERQSRRGRTVRIILPPDQRLRHGALLAALGTERIVLNLLPCEALVIDIRSPTELAQASYAIGNLHIPAQIEAGQIILPADSATEAALGRLGIAYHTQIRRITPIPDILPRLTVVNDLTRQP